MEMVNNPCLTCMGRVGECQYETTGTICKYKVRGSGHYTYSIPQTTHFCPDCVRLQQEIAQKDKALEQAREALKENCSICDEQPDLCVVLNPNCKTLLALTAIDKVLGGNRDE